MSLISLSGGVSSLSRSKSSDCSSSGIWYFKGSYVVFGLRLISFIVLILFFGTRAVWGSFCRFGDSALIGVSSGYGKLFVWLIESRS